MGPRDLLLDCHDRIRRFCRGVTLVLAQPDDPRALATAQACARYFDQALPLHAADEDESVAPRLPPGAALARLQAEHARIEAMRPVVVRALRGFDLATLGEVGPTWVDLLLGHIDHEEREVFPALDALPDPDRVVAEFRARRG